MGLQDKLLKGESTLTGYNGITPPIEDKSQSKLHFDYSVNGNPEILGKPQPSQLDLDGITPKGPNKDGKTIPLNNTFAKGTYKNSAPTEGIGRI
jgi:hypothetical protein|tara:strand:+ start:174 stop:455 length:282 start_codon:yes stop_codon:yes gene_type:complete